MTRSELIAKLASRFPQLTRQDADLSVKVLLEAISDHLAGGGRVEIRGFGSFGVHNRPARLGRNPKTGERVRVPEKRAPHFKSGVELRERINRTDQQVSKSPTGKAQEQGDSDALASHHGYAKTSALDE